MQFLRPDSVKFYLDRINRFKTAAFFRLIVQVVMVALRFRVKLLSKRTTFALPKIKYLVALP